MLTFKEAPVTASTRDRIITVTRRMLEQHDETVHLGDIAILAGVSRQTLHYQFRGKADLLHEVCRVVDAEILSLEAEASDALGGLDAVSALRTHVASCARIEPRLHALAGGLERLRVFDPAAQSVWRAREDTRFAVTVALAEQLATEKSLAPSWPVEAAARMIWSVTSHHAWSDLVAEAGWTTDEWCERTLDLLEGTLLA